jgi:hypothetical protein
VDPAFTVDWFSANIPRWEQLLAPMRAQPGLRFIEVGSWEGRSACWLLQNILTHETSTLTCIDPFTGNRSIRQHSATRVLEAEERFDRNIRSIGAEHRVVKIKKPSRDALCALPAGRYDFLYVDGSHDAADVLADAVLGWRLLRPGAVLIFDDYEWRYFDDPLLCPRLAIDSFLAVFAREAALLSVGWQVVVRKRVGASGASDRPCAQGVPLAP